MSKQVQDFLCEFQAIAKSDGFYIMPRACHNKTLLDLEITNSMAKEIILNLTVAQYKKGPLEDDKHPETGEIYVFMTNVDDKKIYIKLKIDISSCGRKIAKCLSFHN